MPNPAWFIESHYAAQKVAQMNVTGWGNSTEWAAGSWQGALDAYNAEHNTNITAYDNFLACNGADYRSNITAADINVGPNPYFDPAIYLQNLADFANESGYTTATVAAGQWTAALALQNMLQNGHMSAWEHYKGQGMRDGINPSNNFDTTAYLAARAQAAGVSVDDMVNQLIADGNNPVMDWYINGQTAGITTPPVPAESAVVPDGWTPWGAGELPAPGEETDPYDQNVSTVTMTAAQTTYPGEGESYTGNTQFDAVWSAASADRTLTADTIITGPAGQHNTLSVDLGTDWKGFNQPKVDGKEVANVTNIGRLELTHSDTHADRAFTFDATGIQGLERVDIHNTGAGPISLKDLTASVTTINIDTVNAAKENSTKVQTTTLNYAKGELDGKDDSLTIGLKDVGGVTTNGGNQYAPIAGQGIENLTLDAQGTAVNYVDLSNFKGVTTLAVKGSGNVVIGAVADGIRTYDASEATGTVNMAASDITSSTVVKGGSGYDTVTLNEAASITPASWTGIEALQVGDGGLVNAVNIEGLQALYVTGGSNFTLRNLTAENFTVTQSDPNANSTVRGEITNLTYNTAGGKDGYSSGAHVTSDVTESVTVNVLNQDDLATGWQGTFNDAEGDVVLNVAEGTSKDHASFAGTFKATSAETFTANINGQLGAGAKFNVVDGDPEAGRAITINASSTTGMTASKGISLDADGATEVTISAVGALTVLTTDSSLKGAEEITISLDTTDAQNPDSFALNVNLPSAQSVTVNAGIENVTLKDLGSDNNESELGFNIREATDVTIGNVATGSGWDITGKISADGDVTIGNVGGKAANIDLDFSNVNGDVKGVSTPELSATGTITYKGAEGADALKVAAIGSGTSTFDLGAGKDALTIDGGALASKASAIINVDLGDDGIGADGKDTLTLSSMSNAGAHLTVNVENFVGQDTLSGITSWATVTKGMLDAIEDDFGLSIDASTKCLFSGVTIAGASSLTGVYLNGNAYLFDSATPTMMVVLEGVDLPDGTTLTAV